MLADGLQDGQNKVHGRDQLFLSKASEAQKQTLPELCRKRLEKSSHTTREGKKKEAPEKTKTKSNREQTVQEIRVGLGEARHDGGGAQLLEQVQQLAGKRQVGASQKLPTGGRGWVDKNDENKQGSEKGHGKGEIYSTKKRPLPPPCTMCEWGSSAGGSQTHSRCGNSSGCC